jgi:hypothetical protein
MVRPLDVAWSILKIDLHMGSDSAGHHVAQSHIDSENYASDMYERPVMHVRGRVADFPELNHNVGDEEVTRRLIEAFSSEPVANDLDNIPLEVIEQAMGRLPFNSDLPHMEGPADTPNFPRPLNDKFGRYHRGGSVPRLHEDGSYVGAELSGLGEIFEEDFDKGAERIASTGAHEHVHRLINDEIEQWAREQTNIEALKRQQKENIERLTQQHPPQEKFKRARKRWLKEPRTAEDVLRRAGIDYEPYGDERYPETFTDYEVDMAEGAFGPLRSIGHEFGAYSLTPDSRSPTGFRTAADRFNAMGDRIYQGAEFFHPDPTLRGDLSELHVGGPSEDQVRYEQMLPYEQMLRYEQMLQMLQEQQAAGDVSPQTSVQ